MFVPGPDWVEKLAFVLSAQVPNRGLDDSSWPLPGVVRTDGADGADGGADGADGGAEGADGGADGADGADGPFPVGEGWVLVLVLVMVMVRVRPLPRRLKAISMPPFRKNVAARRTLPDRASGLSGQFLDLATRSATNFERSTKSSVAVPVHTVRVCVKVRTAAATTSASITASTASSRLHL